MLTPESRGGFTLVEVMVALVILSVSVLGLAAGTTGLTTAAARAERSALALYSVQDRIAVIDLDSRYADLESLYDTTEVNVLNDVPGYTRTTSVVHVNQTSPTVLNYKVVTVSMDGPLLRAPVTRRLLVGAP